MAFHMDVIAERAAAAYAETVAATTSIQVFDRPSNAILEMLERQAGAGVPLTVKSFHLGGFTRSAVRAGGLANVARALAGANEGLGGAADLLPTAPARPQRAG